MPLYAKSVEFDPLQAAHCFKLGQCHFRLGDNANAIGWLTKAIELDPKNIESYGQRGLAHGASGNLESAIADFDRVLALHAHDIWCVRAVYQVKLGRVDDYEGSIAKERSKESPSIPGGSRPGPSDAPTWWFTLAPIDWDGMNKVVEVARQRLRDSEKARGLEAPETRLLRKELGTALYRVGNFDEAARELTAALTPPEGEGAMDVQQRSLAASFLSMAEAKRENAEAAEQWLGLASQWATQWAEAANRSHHQRVRIELAISEATKTLAAN